MGNPNELINVLESPTQDETVALSDRIATELSEYDKRTSAFWLFILATQYYNDIDSKKKFELTDYQLAAEMVINDD